jgi:predicted NUDIX family phosphoesterase
MNAEQVMVVKTAHIRPFAPDTSGRAGTLITRKTDAIIESIRHHAEFIPRHAAEHDPSFKQIIPYVAIRYGHDYLLLQRTTNQTEKRLHNKYSLGIGGHINPSEAGADDPLMDGLRRELSEEVWVPEPYELTFQGIIHDESSDVSSVHLGLFHVIDLQLREFEIREQDNMTGRWVRHDALDEFYDDMESWSQVVYTNYIKGSGG